MPSFIPIISSKPWLVKWAFDSTNLNILQKSGKFLCLIPLIGYLLKNGMILNLMSSNLVTLNCTYLTFSLIVPQSNNLDIFCNKDLSRIDWLIAKKKETLFTLLGVVASIVRI